MKRDGYIIEEIIEQTNLEESFDDVVRGTLRKVCLKVNGFLNIAKNF